MTLKGQFTQKWKLCHHLLTPKLFLSCMNCFLLLNTIYNDDLKKVGNQLPVATDFHSFFSPTMEVNGYQQLFGYQHSLKYLLLNLTEERNLYRLGTTWGWVHDDRSIILPRLFKISSFVFFCAYIYIYIYTHYIAKSIGSPPFNERFDYFSNFHEYKS